MAYTFNSTSGNNYFSGSVAHLDATTPIASVAAGDLIIVYFASRDGATHTSVTDSAGNTYTQIGTAINDSVDASRKLSMWYALPSGSQSNVTPRVNPLTDDDRLGIQWVHYSGISAYQAANSANQATPTTSADAVTVSASASAQPALVVGIGWSCANTTAPAAGSGFTDRGAPTFIYNALGLRLQDKRITATGSTAATFTAAANARHGSFVGIFTEASGATAATKAAFQSMLRRNN